MNPELRSKCDRITHILFAGNASNPISNIEQLSFLIYLKLLDEEEARRQINGRLGDNSAQSLFPGQAARYCWSEWRFKSGNSLLDFIRDEVFPYMASLINEAPQVASYFQDAHLEIQNPAVLKEVLDVLDNISFAELDADVAGALYEYLLECLNAQDAASLGQFRTPRHIRMLMVNLLDPDVGDTVFDPASGTGGLLIGAVEHILGKYSDKPRAISIYGESWLEKRGQTVEEAKREIPNLQTDQQGPGEQIPDWKLSERAISGIEVSRQLMRISIMNLVLHGIRNATIKRANALSESAGLTQDDLNRRYTVILCNPPLAGVLPKESIRKDLTTDSKKTELLFLGIVMEALAPGGRAAVLVPEGLLVGSTSAHVELRRKLMEHYELQAVISLPPGVFKPYAGVKTSVVVFRRPTAEQPVKKATFVWFAEIKHDGFDPLKSTKSGRPEMPKQNDIPELLRAWADFKKSQFTKPPGVEAVEILPPGAPEQKAWWAPISVIAENDFNLAAGRYKPQVGETTLDEDAAALISKTITIERDIIIGLESLLKEVEARK